jgi:hypothetical protein
VGMKRKCGTCKYFRDKGVANSGTCEHFKRRALRDVVLVRQSELACRNTWDQDLWEPHPELLAEEQAAGEVDEVIETQPGTRSTSSIFGGSEIVPIPSPLGEEPDRMTSIRLTPVPGGEELEPAPTMFFDEPEQDVIPVRKSVLGKRMQLEEDRKRLLEARRREALAEIDSRPGFLGSVRSEDASNHPWSAEDIDPSSGAGRPIVPLSEEPMDHQDPTEQLPIGEVQRVLRDASRHVPTNNEPVVHVDGNVYGKRPARRELPVVQEIGLPDSDDPIDRAEHLRGIKRVCGTCRDFRQFGDGTRGQCVNPYAFSERRMVQSDQLACRSSLGTWWMPSDDIWLEQADTSHHGRPTPLLDAATRQERTAGRARDTRSW